MSMTQLASELEATKKFSDFKEKVDAFESTKAMVKSVAQTISDNAIFQENASDEEKALVTQYL